MDRQGLRRELCGLPGAVETQPFGPDVWVYKVGGRMFALVPTTGALGVTIKLEPPHGQLARAQYSAVAPGYHMNKEHWNTVQLGGDVPDDVVREWISLSHALVVAGLPRRVRSELAPTRAVG
ncbi:MAG: MmcQ/YjbR family DNA-binding protein [Candidatus Bipolaricaulota bacterium]